MSVVSSAVFKVVTNAVGEGSHMDTLAVREGPLGISAPVVN